MQRKPLFTARAATANRSTEVLRSRGDMEDMLKPRSGFAKRSRKMDQQLSTADCAFRADRNTVGTIGTPKSKEGVVPALQIGGKSANRMTRETAMAGSPAAESHDSEWLGSEPRSEER